MSNPNYTMYADGEAGTSELMRQLRANTASLRPGETLVGFASRRAKIVSDGVAKILRRLEGADAFDVLDLLRQREVIAPNMGYEEPTSPALATTVEIIAVILVARGARVVGSATRDDIAKRSIEMLHIVGAEIARAGTFSALAKAHEANNAWARLESEYRNARLSIRNLHYRSIDDALNARLFADGPFARALNSKLPFTFQDFREVRDAVLSRYADSYFGAFEQLAREAEERGSGRARSSFDDGLAARVREAANSVHVHPGARAAFTAFEIAQRSNVAEPVVERILELFSVPFASSNPVAAVEAYLDGSNPFAAAALVRDGQGNYLQLSLQIGDDCYRQIVEKAIGELQLHELYNEHRRDVSEALAGDALRTILRSDPAATAYHYFAPKRGIPTTALGPTATNLLEVGNDCEGDLLFVIDDVAICVEVKGGSFSQGARSGRTKEFKREVERIIGGAAAQARRVETLIETNGGFWQGDGSWRDLRSVRELRSIVVTIDDLGPLGTAFEDLVEAKVLPVGKSPWIVSSHDLAVAADLFSNASDFLLYLRRRTEGDTASRWLTVDEMDLLMFFLQSGLQVQPDPEQVARNYPNAPPSSPDDLVLFEEQPRKSRLHVYTNPLDAWFLYVQGEGPFAPKPRMADDSVLDSIKRAARTAALYGATVVGADLQGLGVARRLELSEHVNRAALAARSGRSETFRVSLAGEAGFAAIVVRSQPSGHSQAALEAELTEDLVSVQRDWGCDRTVGLAIDGRGRLRVVGYASSVQAPTFARPRENAYPPPSARRSRKRLRS